MSSHDSSCEFPDDGGSWGCDRRVLAIVAVSLVVASGCGSGEYALLPQVPIEIIRGKDSAGATIELEKRGADLTAARVTDAVLGTGEAAIISITDDSIEFTIEFPAGSTITYLGSVQPPRSLSEKRIGAEV